MTLRPLLNYFRPPYVYICNTNIVKRASLVTQMVKNLPAVQEIWVGSLDWKDPLEKGVTTHSRIAWMNYNNFETPIKLFSDLLVFTFAT